MGVSLSPEFKKYAWMQLPFTPGLLRLSQRLLGILPVHSPYADICTAKRQAGSLPLTLFYPKDRGLQGPCLIFYHGGGFGHPAAPQHRRLAAFLAREAHCTVLCPEYRLLPRHPYPAAREDALTAYAWAASAFPGAALALGGDSAGGALAAFAMTDGPQQGLPAPALLLLIYPVLDGTLSTPSMAAFPSTPLWNARCNRAMWSMLLQGADPRPASPLFLPLPHPLPAVYMEMAEVDCLRDEGLLYARRLQEVGAAVTCHTLCGAPHGYDIAFSAPRVQALWQARAEALRKAWTK